VDDHDKDKGLVPFDFMKEVQLAELIDDYEGSHEARIVRRASPDRELAIFFVWTKKPMVQVDAYALLMVANLRR
jgi:hypothetical protein